MEYPSTSFIIFINCAVYFLQIKYNWFWNEMGKKKQTKQNKFAFKSMKGKSNPNKKKKKILDNNKFFFCMKKV